MRHLLTVPRFLAMILLVLTFLAVMSVVYVIVRAPWERVRWSNRILTHFCRTGLWILGVRVTYSGLEHDRGAALLVGNHLSYLDILCLHARVRTCFVTSREMRETPVLGQICLLAGCLFVERRKRAGLRGEVTEIADGLTRGFNVAIYPEATSGNGEALLRFKRPLFAAATRAARPVVPFCLNYHTVGGRPITRISRDSVFWYGDMDFTPHLWRLCAAGGVHADLIMLPPLTPGPDADPTRLAEMSQAAIEAVYRPV